MTIVAPSTSGQRDWATWDAEHASDHARSKGAKPAEVAAHLKSAHGVVASNSAGQAAAMHEALHRDPGPRNSFWHHEQLPHHEPSGGADDAIAQNFQERAMSFIVVPSTTRSMPEIIAPSVAGTRNWAEWDAEHAAEEKAHGKAWGHAWGEAAKGHFWGKGKNLKGKGQLETPPWKGEPKKPKPPPKPLPKLGKIWGHDRTEEYKGKPAPSDWITDPKVARYGSVIFDQKGRVLLREPKGHFMGQSWTFAKGGSDKKADGTWEHPVETAQRETIEETGRMGGVVGHVPGSFGGSASGSQNNFYLMHVAPGEHPEHLNGETDRLTWAQPHEAEQLMHQTTDPGMRERDLWTLHAAVKEHARLYPDVSTPMEPRTQLTVAPTVKLPTGPGPGIVHGTGAAGEPTQRVAPGKGWMMVPTESRDAAKAAGVAGGHLFTSRDAARTALPANHDLWEVNTNGQHFDHVGKGILSPQSAVSPKAIRLIETNSSENPVPKSTYIPYKHPSHTGPEKLGGGGGQMKKHYGKSSQSMVDSWKNQGKTSYEFPDEGSGFRDVDMFSGNGKLNNWWKWDQEHPEQLHLNGHSWGEAWGAAARKKAEENAQTQVSKGAIHQLHTNAYRKGHELTHRVGVKLGHANEAPQDSKQISDRAAPLYAAAKKAKDAGNAEEHAKLLGAAHGFKQASNEKAAWEKTHGVKPHQDTPGGKGVKVKASVTHSQVSEIAANASEVTPKAEETKPEPSQHYVSPGFSHLTKPEPVKPAAPLETPHSVTEDKVSQLATNPHAAGTPKHSQWKEAFDFAHEYANEHQLTSGAASANAEKYAVKPHGGGGHMNTEASKAGLVAGYHHYAATKGGGAATPAEEPKTHLPKNLVKGDVVSFHSSLTGTPYGHVTLTKDAEAKGPTHLLTGVVGIQPKEFLTGHDIGPKGAVMSHHVYSHVPVEYHGHVNEDQTPTAHEPVAAAVAPTAHAPAEAVHSSVPHSVSTPISEVKSGEIVAGHKFHNVVMPDLAKDSSTGHVTLGQPGEKHGTIFGVKPTDTVGSVIDKHAEQMTPKAEPTVVAPGPSEESKQFTEGHQHALGMAKNYNLTHEGALASQAAWLADRENWPPGYANGMAHGYGQHAASTEPSKSFASLTGPGETAPKPFVPTTKYLEGSPKHTMFMGAHDEALAESKKVGLNAKQATDLQHSMENQATKMHPGVAKAALEGTAAGYEHHAHNVSVPETPKEPWIPKEGVAPKGVSGLSDGLHVAQLKMGDTFPSGHHIDKISPMLSQPGKTLVTVSKPGQQTSANLVHLSDTVNHLVELHNAKNAEPKPEPTVAFGKAPPGGWKEEDKVAGPTVTAPKPVPPTENVSAASLKAGDKVMAYNHHSATNHVHTITQGGKDLTGKYFFKLASDEGHPGIEVGGWSGHSKMPKVVTEETPKAPAAAAEPKVLPSPALGDLPKTEADFASMNKLGYGDKFMNGEKVPDTGTKGGGQWYEHPGTGKAYLLKNQQDTAHAEAEVAGSLAYQQAGVPSQRVSLVKMNDGTVKSASEYIPNIKPIGLSHPITPEDQADARKNFGMDALLSHYDMVGVENNNLFKDANGKVVRLDFGAVGPYRGLGPKKSEAEWSPGDWKANPEKASYNSMRTYSSQGKAAYGQPTDPMGADMKESLAKAAHFDTDKYHQSMIDAGISKEFADHQVAVLKGRQEHLFEEGMATPAALPKPAAATPATHAESTPETHDVYGLKTTPEQAKEALHKYETSGGSPSPDNVGGYNGVNSITDAMEQTGIPGMTQNGLWHGTKYSDLHKKLQEVAGHAPATETHVTPTTAVPPSQHTLGPLTMTHQQALDLKSAMENDLLSNGNPKNNLGVYLQDVGIPYNHSDVTDWKQGLPHVKGGGDYDAKALQALNKMLAGEPSEQNLAVKASTEPYTGAAAPSDIHLGPITMTHAKAVALKNAMESHLNSYGNPLDVVQNYMDHLGIPHTDSEVYSWKMKLPSAGENSDADGDALKALNDALESSGGTSQSAIPTVSAAQAISGTPGAATTSTLNSPASFAKQWLAAGQPSNKGWNLVMPGIVQTSKDLKTLPAYALAHNTAVETAASLSAQDIQDDIEEAKAQLEDALTPSVRSRLMGLIDGLSHALATGGAQIPDDQGTVPVDLTTLPAFAQAKTKADAALADGMTSKEMYQKAGELTNSKNTAAAIAWHNAAVAADFQENEKPAIEIGKGAPSLSDTQVAYMKQAAHSQTDQFDTLPRWAYRQGRAMGIDAGNIAVLNGAKAEDIEHEALHHEELAKQTKGLLSYKHRGIARTLHRVAEAHHEGNALDANGKPTIATSKSANEPKPDVSYHAPGTAGAMSTSYHQAFQIKPEEFTGDEKKAIKVFTTASRWKDPDDFYRAMNAISSGKDPGTGHSVDLARIMLKMAAEKSTPSTHTIYRKTGSTHLGALLAQWEQQLIDLAGQDLAEEQLAEMLPTFSVPIASHTYGPEVWHGSVQYTIDPGAMTLDIGAYTDAHFYTTGEIETVTGGLMQIYKIEHTSQHGSPLTKIYMRQLVHYAI